MSFSDLLENEILDHVFGANVYTSPATVWFGLSTADPLDTWAGLAEPVGNGYARVARVNDNTTFQAAAAGLVDNAIEIAFPEASGSWGTVTHVALFTHITSTGLANSLGSGALGTSKAVGAGDTARFQVGSLSITLD